MRIYLLIVLSFFSINALAFDETYVVSGSDDQGEPVEGKAFVTFGESEVSGEIMTDDGVLQSFQGELRDGRIYARTQSGTTVELKMD